MSRYSVDTNALRNADNKYLNISMNMKALAKEINAIKDNLSSDIKRYEGVDTALRNCSNNVATCRYKVDNYGASCGVVASLYSEAENNVINNISKGKFEQGFQNGQNDNGNWLQNWISDLIKTLPTIMGKIFPWIGTIIGLPGWITDFDEILAGIGKGIIASGARTTGWSSILGDMWNPITGGSDSGSGDETNPPDRPEEPEGERGDDNNTSEDLELKKKLDELFATNEGKSFPNEYHSCWGCCAFTKYIWYEMYGYHRTSADICAECKIYDSEDIMNNIHVGDCIKLVDGEQEHWFIVAGWDENGITVYQSTGIDNGNIVEKKTYPWSGGNSQNSSISNFFNGDNNTGAEKSNNGKIYIHHAKNYTKGATK
ncbi:hypothetical protein [Butyrivibrio sp. YAB3001]|uniref:hypothetical protein n=1 Tax=Butyrivibrio sp. YAB3001 TaxID=1520812 RepID=UPI0008F6618E|nr:hypothetical protein [Butyrivibrio sp. YAB3001]SFB82290.1 hypothetical protein SAMN02910398_00751 [Butyrivibrio sp. YAB3001]